ncbi:roadblock/LC7 domain-containing protein [Micromonospora craniellae]|uniref:Roadblock/LC7 domain-containing protein n=1 Tax=Micromonospora craniellae TaxID=2294034 RepID=A0A372FR38_9ACTN|nr:roadblock/LC7 domain-containing protein [Micromonospora craniellae]QOC94407.1 roadblock/LC7 domain-containing protein [Micromonospora craniellae]RFS43193.1 roadblock/LC7 domain-containing protein [Micromonospora craniellae]
MSVITSTANARNPQLSVVLDGMARQMPDVAHVVAVSGDGLLLASTAALDGDRGDQLAAIVSGLVSLARGTADLLETGGVQFQMLMMHDGILVVQQVSDGSSLAALARADCDPAAVAYELAALAARIGEAVKPGPRTAG